MKKLLSNAVMGNLLGILCIAAFAAAPMYAEVIVREKAEGYIFIDREKCVQCLMCVSTAPDFFSEGDDGEPVPVNGEVNTENAPSLVEAIDGCPSEAIVIIIGPNNWY